MTGYFNKNHTTMQHGDRSDDVSYVTNIIAATPDPLAASSNWKAAEDGDNIIPLEADDGDNGGASCSTTSRTNKKHQLHVQVDADTRLFIDRLANKAEVKRTSELVRAALREFERALYEFDELRIPVGVGTSPAASDTNGSTSKDSAAPGTLPKSSVKDEHFSLVLDQREMGRVKRLKGLISAKSMADVVLLSLCVYDALLDHRNDLVVHGGKLANIVRIDKQGHKASIAQIFKRSG